MNRSDQSRIALTEQLRKCLEISVQRVADRKCKKYVCAGSSGLHLPEPPPPSAGGHASPGVGMCALRGVAAPAGVHRRMGWGSATLLSLGLDTRRRTG